MLTFKQEKFGAGGGGELYGLFWIISFLREREREISNMFFFFIISFLSF